MEAFLLNDYVRNGKGDPRKLLQGLNMWPWDTQEVLDMIEWMREYNLSGKGVVQFTGAAISFDPAGAANIRSFVSVADPGYLVTLDAALARAAAVQSNYQKGISQTAAAVQPVIDAVHAVVTYLTDHRGAYLRTNAAGAVDWAIQNARLVEQATYLPIAPGYYWDQSMAANIEWIAQQNPGAKIVFWGHDWRVQRAIGTAGSYLAANHGADYVVFGQFSHAGIYNAVSRGALSSNVAPPSFPGTVEYLLHSTGMPSFFLDLRSASLDEPGSAWLLNSTQYRTIGAQPVDGFGFSYRVTRNYDVLVFFNQTTPSRLPPAN